MKKDIRSYILSILLIVVLIGGRLNIISNEVAFAFEESEKDVEEVELELEEEYKEIEIEDETSIINSDDIESTVKENVNIEKIKKKNNRINNGNRNSFGQLSLVKFIEAPVAHLGGLALDSEGSVWTWGWNGHGAAGMSMINSTSDTNSYYGGMKRIPYFEEENIKIIHIDSNYHNRMALDDSGNVYTWGHGAYGEMGNGRTIVANYTPNKVPLLKDVIQIYSNNGEIMGFNFALDKDGVLRGWGHNSSGQLGLGYKSTRVLTPEIVPLPEEMGKIVKLSSGDHQSFILDDKNQVWYSGSNTGGRVANGKSTRDTLTFTRLLNVEGMDQITDIDTSFGRTLARDVNGNIWQWGVVSGYGNTGGVVNLSIPTLLEINDEEIERLGYKPLGQKVFAGEHVSYFIDQYGRSWASGNGLYFGFGIEGGYSTNNEKKIRKAENWPRIIGDGDTNTTDSKDKFPKYVLHRDKGTTEGGILKNSTYNGYGVNTLHPTIYDEKYMLKDEEGYLMDKDGDRIEYNNRDRNNRENGLYYKLDDGNQMTTNVGYPIPDPDERGWIELAFKEIPAIESICGNRSFTTMIDKDGNLYKWGLDGSGSIAWGWDYDKKYDSTGNAQGGLYDKYVYEVMYMRGAPSIDTIDLLGTYKKEKIYKTDEKIRDKVKIIASVPESNYNNALESSISSDINNIKYVIVPYNADNPDFNINMEILEKEEFEKIFNNKTYKSGNLLEDGEAIKSSDRKQRVVKELEIEENCKIFILAENERYTLDKNNQKNYQNFDYIPLIYKADNFYTPIEVTHSGLVKNKDTTDEILTNGEDAYEKRDEYVKKINIDGVSETIYGLPLDEKKRVIGKTLVNNEIIYEEPTFGYDEVHIEGFELKGYPKELKYIETYYKFKKEIEGVNQEKEKTIYLNDEVYIGNYDYKFIYEIDPDFWTIIKTRKEWIDQDDLYKFRPDKITLTLKQYKRDIKTGEQGEFIRDIKVVEVEENKNGEWSYDFGLFMSYEYTYEIKEDHIKKYLVKYENMPKDLNIVGTNENFSEAKITNTIDDRGILINKVDEKNSNIIKNTGKFNLFRKDGKVISEEGKKEDLLEIVTDEDGRLIIPFQEAGEYLLREIKAPIGYNLLRNDLDYIVDASGNIDLFFDEEYLREIDLDSIEKQSYLKGYNLLNKEAAELPMTGGMGIYGFVFLGLAMMIINIYLYKNKE